MTDHETAREKALADLDDLAEQWLEARTSGRELSSIEEKIQEANRRSRRAEEKIRRDEKRKTN